MPAFSDELVRRLRDARHVTIFTGAGMSAESGVPTFRDPDGLWQRFSPEELANVDAFLSNPVLVQSWYAHRHEIISSCEPHAGHRALARLEQHVPASLVITQNVDNLHQRAGSEEVLELHGNLTRSYCIECERAARPGELPTSDADEPAYCPECGGLIRPDVVWFGEMLPEGAIERAEAAIRRTDLFLAIGTSAVVQPAASLPLVALDYGAYVAEINPRETGVSRYVDETIRELAGGVLPDLVDHTFSPAAE